MRLYFLLPLAVAACTSPYDFSKQTTAVSTGVDQMADGFTAGFAGLAADRAARAQLALTDARAEVDIAQSCSATKGPAPCALFRLGAAQPALLPIEQARDDTLPAVATLKDYAHALMAVTNAADRASYDAAVMQLSGSVGALAKNAGPVLPGISTVAPAGINLIGWLVGTELDQRRFDSLKKAVTAVGTAHPGGQKPIAIVTEQLGKGLAAIDAARRTELYDEAKDLKLTLSRSLTNEAYRQRLVDTEAVVTVLDGLRRSSPTATTDALLKAHDSLVAAVNDPKQNYSDLLKSVGDFADKAAALRTAFAATAAPPRTVKTKGT